ncbi:nucleotide sugar dehydrogenase [Tsuneonella sp. YG55]|uniref:Nucleotide sugar dehydrogenase n=1 Tax=Tsuneonella litorea TaxID=2976475 RepID=A0A9X2VYR7_9SPHN|nr:nucleotide sugar dehydrogenase [Tsuneonella litorea]MCT2557802.1 nucleotide sugar dehydrogenase [Tsuneonella litorea]
MGSKTGKRRRPFAEQQVGLMAIREKIVILGLGYVGLPLAVALAGKHEGVVGFDVSKQRVDSLRSGTDWTGEIDDGQLQACSLEITGDEAALSNGTFFIITVPTPIDCERRPDLGPIRSACQLVAPHLTRNAVVVFESTVYPGVTEDECGPLLEAGSGLKAGEDFFLGYSPERINPGDKEHRLETITKIVAADTPSALERVIDVYGSIIEAGLYVAPSIKVAEAAKVIENTQRDINIALMNEIALIFDRMGLRTRDVLEAAGTKWNFLKFSPGLVGGHCIGVDPYYLTSAAERLGYRPEVILAGRRINDSMGGEIARKGVKLLLSQGHELSGARVGIFGLTFKENVPDLRNSKVPDIVAEFREFGIDPLINDPFADGSEAQHEYGLTLSDEAELRDLNVLVLAVNHRHYLDDRKGLIGRLKTGGVLLDVKSALDPTDLPADILYWSL